MREVNNYKINNQKFIFFGSPEFAAVVLDKLIKAGYMPAALVCNPDGTVGRKKILTSPLTKQLVVKNNWPIKIFQPAKLREIIDELKQINADFFVVAAYAKIIPKEIFEIPRLKTIGVHPSLLPKYRGPSPIQGAILNGEKESGVTIFLIDEKIDHGPILADSKLRITNSDNYISLSRNLAEAGADLLIEILPKYANGEIKPEIQDENEATYTKKFTKEDSKIDLKNDSPQLIYNKVRAFNPEPGVFAVIETNNKKITLKLLDAEFNGSNLNLLRVQPEGKRQMTYKEFLNGYGNILSTNF